MSLKTWKLNGEQRWYISMKLKTESPLHIGSGQLAQHPDIYVNKTDNEGKVIKKPVDINACIKGKNKLPIIPGSSIKGEFYDWLNTRKNKDNKSEFEEIRDKLFGKGHDVKTGHQGRAGKVEFHDAYLSEALADGTYLPYWNKDEQTFIDTSTAIDRHSKTALKQSLHYTQCVPAGVQFTFTFTGVMNQQEAGLLLAILDSFYSRKNYPCLGADNANGYGRMEYVGHLDAKVMGSKEIANWLMSSFTDNMPMAMEKARKLEQQEKQQLIAQGKALFNFSLVEQKIPVTLKFDGPFLVNDPYQVKQLEKDNENKTNHFPLLDSKEKPKLPSASIRGVLRSQAERIIRTLGGTCCDTQTPCAPVYDTAKLENLCLACQLFGATGWKTVINIDAFTCENAPEVTKQEFIAIDRFHGGGKDGAKFDATVFEMPEFKGAITFSHRMEENGLNWGKGLIALVLRDLHEADITFGFGANKGYGHLEKNASGVDFSQFDASDVGAFRDLFKQEALESVWENWDYKGKRDMFLEASQPWHCDEINTPSKQGEKTSIASGENTGRGFHNPYQFIPIQDPKDAEHWLNRDVKFDNKSPHSHAHYRDQTDKGKPLYHGRIACQLTTETPLFIGAKKDNSEPAKIENYKLKGEIAIPATSLRGMISSLAEAASNSSMRVLDNGLLSYRKPMRESLSAIGMVIKNDQGYRLIPLVLPTLQRVGKKFKVADEFKQMFPDGPAKLKVYLNNEYTKCTNNKTWTKNHNQIHYLNLTQTPQLNDGKISDNTDSLRKPQNKSFVIGLKPLEDATISKNPVQGSTPGLLRIFGAKPDRNGDVPGTKKHELFIPIPSDYVVDNQFDFEAFKSKEASFEIPLFVVNRFHELADQQTKSQKNIGCEENWLPYHLIGMQRTAENKLAIQEGDLVYFCPNKNKPAVVEEISFSSIWRGRVEENAMESSRVHHFIPDELLPFNEQRTKISPTELLFGFTELNQDTVKADKNTEAFAGKVSITAGTACSKDLIDKDSWIPLKALSSPKLPSPSLYFHSQTEEDRRYIAKQDLDSKKHKINGRKQYLHALREKDQVQKLTSKGQPGNSGDAKLPWITQDSQNNAQLKVQIVPIKEDKYFKFYLDFNNLTEWELGLLCYALRPTGTFRHRLGMGKPLGLGTVKIDIDKIETINRKQRYAEDDIAAARYHQEQTLSSEKLIKIFTDTMKPDIYRALDLLGNPENVKYPVHYPQVQNGDIELENFKWFVANDIGSGSERDHNKIDAKKETMKTLNEQTTVLPTLTRPRYNND